MKNKGRPRTRQQLRNWPALVLALVMSGQAAASASTLRDAIAQLKQEAIEARQAKAVPERPDFAKRFSGTISDELLQAAMGQRADADPFVDAYIRWQLTSFQPRLAWSDREFMAVLAKLPPMIENPRGDETLILLLQRAVQSGPLTPADTARLQELLGELDDRVATAEQLNRPAVGLRQWLHDAVEDNQLQRLQVTIEQCAATVDAAWSTRSVKSRLSRALSETSAENALGGAERRIIAAQLQQLAGRHRRFVNEVTFMADGTVNVTFSNARVTQRDVDAWLLRMAGER